MSYVIKRKWEIQIFRVRKKREADFLEREYICIPVPACRGVSAMFSGVSRLLRCVRLLFLCPKCRGVCAFFSGVSRLPRFVRLVFCCDQIIAVCPPCK